MNKNVFFKNIFLILTLTSILFLGLITVFLLIKGITPMFNGNFHLFSFITGTRWEPSQDLYGIGYMIVGTLLSTLGAIILVVPIALFTSVMIVEFLPKRLSTYFTFVIELLAGIPSVLYGLFGLGVFVPLIRQISPSGSGQSLIAVILVLAMMVLPTIISLAVSSLKAVDDKYRHASQALGADKIQTSFLVILPAARSGIMAAIVLGVGRAIGETMAVTLVAGNVAGGIPTSLFSAIRPMTANIALEMGYASGYHQQLLFTTGLMLFIFIMVLNLFANYILKRGSND